MKNTPLILLHGALGAAADMAVLKVHLAPMFDVLVLELEGHGKSEIMPENFNTRNFSEQLLSFINQNSWQKVNIFGYSMGGYVAMELAKRQPQLIQKIITLGTKWAWSEEIAEKEIKMLNPAKIAEKVPTFAAALAAKHHDWQKLMLSTADLMQDLGKNALTENDLKAIEVPTTLLLGDADNMVTLAETQQTSTWLPNATFKIMDNTPHPFEKVNYQQLAAIISDIL